MYQEEGCLRQNRTPTTSSRTDTRILTKTRPFLTNPGCLPEIRLNFKDFVKNGADLGQIRREEGSGVVRITRRFGKGREREVW